MLPSLIGIIASSGGAAAGGDYESIATVTVGSGGASSISFTSIPSTYQHLQIRGIARGADSANNRNLHFNFNSDTGSNYAYHFLAGDGSSASAGSGISQAAIIPQRMPAASSTANLFGVVVADVLDYANVNKNKTFRALSGFDDNGGTFGSVIRINSGLWMNTNAITSIEMVMGVGNFAQYSSFALYGIKG